MKSLAFRALATTTALTGALWVAPAHAQDQDKPKPNQYVVIVAEGLSPQVLNLGKGYLRKTDEDPEELTSFDTLMKSGTAADAGKNPISDLSGLLETAEKNGYKTGLVTTGDITTVAPLFYDMIGNPVTALTSPTAKYDFIAGGGRAHLGEGIADKIKAAGGTYLPNQEDLDGEIKGRVLAPQKDDDLDYAIDRNVETQAGIGELASLAIDTLGVGDSPFVLVIHDTLIKKALDTKDSPALVEEFRELNSVLADTLSRRDDNPNLKVAALLTGGPITPRFTTDVEAEQQNSYFILSNIILSYANAGKTLKGANADAITAFADPVEGQYKGWKVAPDVRQQIIAGTIDPETAIRASYEPAVKLNYAAQTAAPVAYTLGFDTPQGLVAALKSAVSTPAK